MLLVTITSPNRTNSSVGFAYSRFMLFNLAFSNVRVRHSVGVFDTAELKLCNAVLSAPYRAA